MNTKTEQANIQAKINIVYLVISKYEILLTRNITDQERIDFKKKLDREKRNLDILKSNYPEFFI